MLMFTGEIVDGVCECACPVWCDGRARGGTGSLSNVPIEVSSYYVVGLHEV